MDTHRETKLRAAADIARTIIADSDPGFLEALDAEAEPKQPAEDGDDQPLTADQAALAAELGAFLGVQPPIARALKVAAADQARGLLKAIVSIDDPIWLMVAWEETKARRDLVWATPAFLATWGGLWNIEGELALVGDRLVFFKFGWKAVEPRFVLKLSNTQFKWSRRKVTLDGSGERYRVSFMPPRHTNLSVVAGSAEEPGLADLADKILPPSEMVEALGLVSESLQMLTTSRIARIHTTIWKSVVEDALTGMCPPYGILSGAGETNQVNHRPPPTEAPKKRPRALPNRREQVLNAVRRHPGLTPREIASLLDTNPNAIYRPINQLIAAGLVERRDRRLYRAQE